MSVTVDATRGFPGRHARTILRPTMAEAGVTGYQVYEWNAIFAPAGTPAAVVAKIAGYGPADAERFVREQAELWGKVVRAGNINVD
jgi:hypothetical protein